MPNPITVQGELNPYSTSGRGTVTNVGTFSDPNNINQVVTDLDNLGGIKTSRIYTVTAATSGNPATVQIPNNVDTVNVVTSPPGGTIANLTLSMPMGAMTGVNLRFVFDAAVTALTLVAPNGYSIAANAPTTAAAQGHFLYENAGGVWKAA